MCSTELTAWAIVSLVVGPPSAIWPYKLARWGEILDAIGRTPSGRVEPANWNVLLTQVVGVGMSVFGVGWVLFCVVL